MRNDMQKLKAEESLGPVGVVMMSPLTSRKVMQAGHLRRCLV